MSPDDPRHGSNKGYMVHYRAKEKACDPCRDAHTAYRRQSRPDVMRLNGICPLCLGPGRPMTTCQSCTLALSYFGRNIDTITRALNWLQADADPL